MLDFKDYEFAFLLGSVLNSGRTAAAEREILARSKKLTEENRELLERIKSRLSSDIVANENGNGR